MARKRTPREQIFQLAASGLTQKQIAARLGVHARTIRKWKSGETKPDVSHARKLSNASERARQSAREYVNIEREDGSTRRVREKKRAVALPRDVPIPRAVRREIRDYRDGKWQPDYGYKLSDWLNYNVKGYSVADVAAFVRGLSRSAGKSRPYIQLVYLAPVEDTNVSGTPYLANKRYQRSGSMIRDLGGLDEAGIVRWVLDELDAPGRKAMFVAVAPSPTTENAATTRRRRRIWRARKEGSSKA